LILFSTGLSFIPAMPCMRPISMAAFLTAMIVAAGD
jgi:hypothetical protein